jgi:hypothetical protein
MQPAVLGTGQHHGPAGSEQNRKQCLCRLSAAARRQAGQKATLLCLPDKALPHLKIDL